MDKRYNNVTITNRNDDVDVLIAYMRREPMYRQAAGANLFFITGPFDGALYIIADTITIGHGKDHFYQFVIHEGRMNEVAREIWDAVVDGSSTPVDERYSEWKQRWSEHEAVFERFEGSPLEGLSLDSVLGELQQYFDHVQWMWAAGGYLVDCFDPSGDSWFQEDVFSKAPLMTEDERSKLLLPYTLTTAEMIELRALELLQQEEEGDAAQQLQDEFHWIENDYAGARRVELMHFQRVVDDLRKELSSTDKQEQRIEELRSHEERLRSEQNEIFDRYDFTDRMKGLVVLFSTLTAWREERKRQAQRSDMVWQKFADAIARETGLSFEEVTMGDPRDRDLFCTPEGHAELKKRVQNGVIYAFDECNMSHSYISDADEVDRVARLMYELQTDGQTEVTGNIANKGVVTGTVKIVNRVVDFEKFEEGDVLVSAMTRPELMPIVRKAAAIVTDEGGVTCHAAVISREMGVPCIIGTGNATALLKDGDLVEVDADNGVVHVK